MRTRTEAIDFKKAMRHFLTAAGALLLIGAAGLDRVGPAADPVQQASARTR